MDLSGTQSIHIQIAPLHLQELERAFKLAPEKVRVQVLNRAMRSLKQTALSRYTRRAGERLKINPTLVRQRTTMFFNAGGNTQDMIVRSGWIHLYRFGAKQTASGVMVKTRGSYRHAFLAQFESGHRGVMRRVPGTRMKAKGKGHKEQIRELFGPNPASDVANNPAVYEQFLAQLIDEVFFERVASQLERVLPG